MTRVAVIDREICNPKKCGNYLCMRVCPVNRSGDECIVVGEDAKPIIDENLCIGCGICPKKCPFDAITIVNLPEQLKEKPIHRFGENQFVLFRLPFPIRGQVVGLVGSNGLGKTTALRVLSGEIKPNMGESGEVDFSELLTMFRGTELQNHLQKLKEGKIKVSFKPQRVDKVPDEYSGKVSKLLEKTDERGILSDLITRFGLEGIQNKKINEISGGELQRVAVAACLARDSTFYYFDEPMSFLDVFERLEVSKTIRELCKDKSVMVTDHDLATLDFLADRVHIFYGIPAVYGIVSNPYSVRSGINTFLDGYIREDNVRFRQESIVFEPRSPVTVMGDIFLKINGFKKGYDGFRLKTEPMEIHEKEVIGILGPNATGKTTFVKILAGKIKPDEGKVEEELKISYKPQHLESGEGLVIDFLRNEIKERMSENVFKSNIMRPLGIDKILRRKVSQLSGGELQSLAITRTLGKECDILIMDEPSAFLDVEKRLSLAKILRGFVEENEIVAFIVDHDIQFIDAVNNRLIVFEGKPGVEGYANPPTDMRTGMNKFLSLVDVTYRRDPQTGRARGNKPGSVLDRKQKQMGKFFYA